MQTVQVTQFQSHANDTGSVAVQVARLSQTISELTEHLKIHRKDHSSRAGLLKMVGRRRRLLNYMAGNSMDDYQKLIKELGLRK